MIALANETLMPVPVPRVWEALLAFDRYAEWHPFIRLRGEAVLGAEIDYIYTTKWFARRTATASATMIELEPGRQFGVRIRIWRLFSVIERFVLQAAGGGTKLWHGLEYHGLISRLAGDGIGRRSAPMMREVDAALRDYLLGEQRACRRKAISRPAGLNGRCRPGLRGRHRR